MRKNKTCRVLAWILTASLVLEAAPFSAYADDSTEMITETTLAPETETGVSEMKTSETETIASETEIPAVDTNTLATETDALERETEMHATETDTLERETEMHATEMDVLERETEMPATETEIPVTESAAEETDPSIAETEPAFFAMNRSGSVMEPTTASYTTKGDTSFKLTVTSASGGVLPTSDYYVTVDAANASMAEAADAEAIGSFFEENYEGTITYLLYKNIRLTNGTTEAELPNDAVYTVQVTTGNDYGIIFSYKDGKLTQMETTKETTQVVLSAYGTTVEEFADFDFVVALSDAEFKEKKEENGPAYGIFAEGTYTVTANLYVKGENNIVLPNTTAYLTNPNVPPTQGVKMNAKMTVDEKGYVTLTVPVANMIFSLQRIEEGTNVHIKNAVYGVDAVYEGVEGAYGPYNGRYQELTLTLDDIAGEGAGVLEYAFTNCVEYAGILTKDQVKTMPVHLGVDFSSARKDFTAQEGEAVYKKTFTDEESGISLEVETTEAVLGLKLQSAVFSVDEKTGDELTAVQKILEEYYMGMPTMTVYDISLEDADGASLSIEGNTQAVVKFSKDLPDSMTLWYIDGDAAETLQFTEEDAGCSVGYGKMGVYAVVDKNSTQEFVKYPISDTETGASVVIYEKSEKAYNVANATLVVEKEAQDDGTVKWYISSASEDKSVQYPFTYGGKQVYTIPLANETDRLYLVLSDEDGTYIKELDITVAGGKASFMLSNGIGYGNNNDELEALYSGWSNYTNGTSKSLTAYVLEVSGDEKILVPAMTATYGDPLVYNGQKQTGVVGNPDLYTVENGSGKDAGTYKAVLTLTEEAIAEGYVWVNGSKESMEMSWRIGKKEVTVAFNRGGTVQYTDDVRIVYDGWVEGDSEETEELPTIAIYESVDYMDGDKLKSKRIKMPYEGGVLTGRMMPGLEYNMAITTPEHNTNYDITYIGAGENRTIQVAGLAVPDSVTLTYTGEEQCGIPESPYYTVVSGDAKATDAGTYTVTLALNSRTFTNSDGTVISGKYKWNEKTGKGLENEKLENAYGAAYRCDATITWTIEKAPLTATYAGETVTEGQTPALKVDVTGFVNGESAESVLGDKMPAIPAQSNLTAGETRTLAPIIDKDLNSKLTNYYFLDPVPGVLTVTAAKTEDPKADDTKKDDTKTDPKDSGTETPATETPATETPSTETPSTEGQATKSQLKVKKTSITKTYGAKAFKLGATAQGKLTYKSSNTKIAKVSSSGTVTIKGSGTVTITVKAARKGVYKAETKKIKLTVKPKKATLTKVKAAAKNKTVVKWKKDKKATGYQLQYAANKKFTSGKKTINMKKYSAVSKTLKKLKSKKTYYVRVRAYKTSNGKKIYGAWSTVKKVTTK